MSSYGWVGRSLQPGNCHQLCAGGDFALALVGMRDVAADRAAGATWEEIAAILDVSPDTAARLYRT